MSVILFLLSTATSVIGSICGIGGGVLTKPFLDAMGLMGVSAASFLSGLTVLSMAIISVWKNLRGGLGEFDRRTTPALALGAAAGGVIGKIAFSAIRQAAGSEALVGLTQSVVLGLITLGTMAYMALRNRDKIQMFQVRQLWASLAIGLGLGVISSFLGIGGGPINLAVLSYFFSMGMKKSAINSMAIILLSQATSLVQTLTTGSVPEFSTPYLLAMVAGGVVGGFLGQRINRCLCEQKVSKLYNGLLIAIVAVCIYNAVRFSAAL